MERKVNIMEKLNWFEIITDRLRDYSEGNVWTDGDSILCKTESAADAISDMMETLYKTQGEEIIVKTGYYDPREDESNDKADRYTGWWYMTID